MIVSHDEAKEWIRNAHLIVSAQNGHCFFPTHDNPYQKLAIDLPETCTCQLETYATGHVLSVRTDQQPTALFFLFTKEKRP